jgi:hypothetical protein
MRYKKISLILVAILLSLPTDAQPTEDLFKTLKQLGNGRYLFGQMGTWVHNENPDMDHPGNWLRKVFDHTGKWPAYGCVTYDFEDNPFTDREWNEAVKKMSERGMIVGIYGWWENPSGGKSVGPADIDPIFAKGTNPIKTNWYQQLDRMANNMQWLEDRNISVIYTPFIELNNKGKWFGTDGKDNAIKLHQMIHNYFTREKGLTNILWGYHTGSNGELKSYYPGDAYVDVMGHSVYHRWGNPELNFFDYEWAVNKKKKQGKVIWMAELGINSEGKPPRDCFDVLEKLEKNYPELAGFVFWGDDTYYNVIGNINGKAFMDHPKIITLE